MNSLRLTWPLLILNLIMLYLLYTISTHKIEPVSGVTADASVLRELPSLPEHELAVSLESTDILERPLFNADRRPVEITEPAEIEALNTANTNAADFKLVGVVMSPDGSQALLLKSDRQIESVFLGNKIEGWKLQSIDPDSIVLVKGVKTIQLELERTTPAINPRARRRGAIIKPLKK